MSTVISRRSFLKCTGASAAALGAASLLGGCKSNGNDTVVEVKVGDTVRNWNGLGVQLTSVFHLTQDPVQPAGYEYLGVRVTAVNRSKTESYAIGAQGIDAINEAYPVPPLENVDANFQAMAAATPDFTAVCDGQPAACCANISLYNANSQSFSDVESLPPQGSAYIVLMLMVPKDWKQLKVTYAHLPGGQEPDFCHERFRCDPQLTESPEKTLKLRLKCAMLPQNIHICFAENH